MKSSQSMDSTASSFAIDSNKVGKAIKKERIKQCNTMFEKTYTNKDGVIEIIESGIEKMRNKKGGKDKPHKNEAGHFVIFEKVYVSKDGVI